MAQIQLTLNYPDAAAPTVLAAFRARYGRIEAPVGSGTYRDRTAAECIQMLEQETRRTIATMVRNYQDVIAIETAKAAVSPIDVT